MPQSLFPTWRPIVFQSGNGEVHREIAILLTSKSPEIRRASPDSSQDVLITCLWCLWNVASLFYLHHLCGPAIFISIRAVAFPLTSKGQLLSLLQIQSYRSVKLATSLHGRWPVTWRKQASKLNCPGQKALQIPDLLKCYPWRTAFEFCKLLVLFSTWLLTTTTMNIFRVTGTSTLAMFPSFRACLWMK